MLSPNDISSKAAAPSIWSFDSGYSSNSLYEEEGILLQPAQPHAGPSFQQNYTQPKQEEPTIEPILTGLSVFTTKDTSDNDFLLPEISSDSETCLECEFWQITNPGENIKCQDCRLPEIVEPAAIFSDPFEGSSKGKEPLPKLEIPDGPVKGHKRSRSITRCSACELSALIDPSGSKSCPSCLPDPSYLSPISPASPRYKVKRSRAGRNSKLPLSALNRLQAWLDANQDDPYPNAETKNHLAQECGITVRQVTTWFTNARARQLNPLDTYLSNSSDEGASESDIAEAAEAPLYNTGGFTYISEARHTGQRNRAASVSGSSAFSSPQTMQRPSRRGKKKDYRRNNATPTLLSPISPETPIAAQDMWQCTFCRKAMVPKSWRRHEETQHRPKAQWTCMLYGPRLSIPARANSTSVCAFCMMKDPSEDHFLHHHRIEDCAKRDISDRTFFRPDHLRQHVKNFHNASLFDIVQARWKRAAEVRTEGWMCGFCGERLDTWDKRETHIANHFKSGLTMASWQDYPDMDKKAEKKGKCKGKDTDHPHSLARFSQSFTRRYTRQSHSSESQQQQQLQQVSFSNAFEPLSASMGLGISQAPVLPDIPPLDPLMIDACGNYIDWTSVPTTLEQQLQYPLANTSAFDPSIETAAMQQEFDSTLNMDLYSNPMDYQGTWDEQQGQHHHHQQQHQHPQ